MRRGDVWWAEHPDEGRRPVCILTRTPAIDVLNRVIVAPLTRTVRAIPTEVLLDERDGMPVESVVSLDNISVVRKGALTEHITTLSPAKMEAVCRALATAVDCRA